MTEEMVDGYATAMRDPVDGDPGVESDIVRSVEREALGRRWRHLAKERLDAVEPRIPLGKKFWELAPEERDALHTLFADERVGAMVLSLKGKPQDRDVRLVDAAYWMKGCSSLGLLRYAAIVALKTRKGNWSYALVDLKEATAPIAPAAPGADMPADDAERVVTAARQLSPYLGSRMMPVTMLGRSLFIRELTPQDLKLEVDQFSRGEAIRAARHLAFVVGTAHARQMDKATRGEWLALLDADRRGTLDTPSWLWESVVSLSGGMRRAISTIADATRWRRDGVRPPILLTAIKGVATAPGQTVSHVALSPRSARPARAALYQLSHRRRVRRSGGAWRYAFRDRSGRADTPVSLYLHIPYCREICWYCGCNTGAANRTARLDAYLARLHAEIDLFARHWRGGDESAGSPLAAAVPMPSRPPPSRRSSRISAPPFRVTMPSCRWSSTRAASMRTGRQSSARSGSSGSAWASRPSIPAFRRRSGGSSRGNR